MANFKRISCRIYHSTYHKKHYVLVQPVFIVDKIEFISILNEDIGIPEPNNSGGFDFTVKFRVCSDQQDGVGGYRIVDLFYFYNEALMTVLKPRYDKNEVQEDIGSKFYNVTCELYDQFNTLCDSKIVKTTCYSDIIINGPQQL